MSVATKYFNGVELGAVGLVTPRVSGVFSMAGEDIARSLVPGLDMPSDVDVRGSLVRMRWGCVVSDTTHSALVAKLATLKGYLSPRLGWKVLTVQNRTGQQTMARCLGLPIDLDVLPYLVNVVEFDLEWDRLPYWEDATVQTATNPGSVANTGQLPTFPTYTCTVAATLSSGLWFTVGGQTFVYTGALANTDVLVVESGLKDVTLNGARAFAGTSAAAEFPRLHVGVNAVERSTTNFSLKIDYRRRYE